MMKQGDRITKARVATLALVFVAVIASLAFDLGLGTPSSFGLGQFFLLCPLGGIEALLASKALVPVTAPATAQRTCSAAREAKGLAASIRHLARDRRTWALGVVLVATLIAGIPLFCLVCPIGLTFGTVGSLWHLIVDKQVTLSAIVFPAALAIELVLYRKWCMNLCPVAGLLNVFGQFARLFRPRVDASTCLQASEGRPCTVCASVCAERINLHAADAAVQLGECTRCGECVKHCPSSSIRIAAKPSDPVMRDEA